MSQNGSDFLSDAGALYTDMLPFYYGADIVLETAVSAVEPPTGQVILAETFDYAGQAALEAVWDDQPDAAGVLDTNVGFPSPSLSHPGGTTSNRTFPATEPTDPAPLVWEFDFLDDGSGNKRITGGLRDDGEGAPLTAILEMGRYNNLNDPESGTAVSGYGVRTVSIGGDPGNWVTFTGNPAVEVGWHRFRATIVAERAFSMDCVVPAASLGRRLSQGQDGALFWHRSIGLRGQHWRSQWHPKSSTDLCGTKRRLPRGAGTGSFSFSHDAWGE